MEVPALDLDGVDMEVRNKDIAHFACFGRSYGISAPRGTVSELANPSALQLSTGPGSDDGSPSPLSAPDRPEVAAAKSQ